MRNLKEARSQISHLNASEPLIGVSQGVSLPGQSKPNILSVTRMRREGRWGEKQIMLLPGEGPLEWKLCNYGMRFPNRGRNVDCMFQGSADEAVVAVKP